LQRAPSLLGAALLGAGSAALSLHSSQSFTGRNSCVFHFDESGTMPGSVM
jgi:hypothetical protein